MAPSPFAHPVESPSQEAQSVHSPSHPPSTGPDEMEHEEEAHTESIQHIVMRERMKFGYSLAMGTANEAGMSAVEAAAWAEALSDMVTQFVEKAVLLPVIQAVEFAGENVFFKCSDGEFPHPVAPLIQSSGCNVVATMCLRRSGDYEFGVNNIEHDGQFHRTFPDVDMRRRYSMSQVKTWMAWASVPVYTPGWWTTPVPSPSPLYSCSPVSVPDSPSGGVPQQPKSFAAKVAPYTTRVELEARAKECFTDPQEQHVAVKAVQRARRLYWETGPSAHAVREVGEGASSLFALTELAEYAEKNKSDHALEILDERGEAHLWVEWRSQIDGAGLWITDHEALHVTDKFFARHLPEHPCTAEDRLRLSSKLVERYGLCAKARKLADKFRDFCHRWLMTEMGFTAENVFCPHDSVFAPSQRGAVLRGMFYDPSTPICQCSLRQPDDTPSDTGALESDPPNLFHMTRVRAGVWPSTRFRAVVHPRQGPAARSERDWPDRWEVHHSELIAAQYPDDPTTGRTAGEVYHSRHQRIPEGTPTVPPWAHRVLDPSHHLHKEPEGWYGAIGYNPFAWNGIPTERGSFPPDGMWTTTHDSAFEELTTDEELALFSWCWIAYYYPQLKGWRWIRAQDKWLPPLRLEDPEKVLSLWERQPLAYECWKWPNDDWVQGMLDELVNDIRARRHRSTSTSLGMHNPNLSENPFAHSGGSTAQQGSYDDEGQTGQATEPGGMFQPSPPRTIDSSVAMRPAAFYQDQEQGWLLGYFEAVMAAGEVATDQARQRLEALHLDADNYIGGDGTWLLPVAEFVSDQGDGFILQINAERYFVTERHAAGAARRRSPRADEWVLLSERSVHEDDEEEVVMSTPGGHATNSTNKVATPQPSDTTPYSKNAERVVAEGGIPEMKQSPWANEAARGSQGVPEQRGDQTQEMAMPARVDVIATTTMVSTNVRSLKADATFRAFLQQLRDTDIQIACIQEHHRLSHHHSRTLLMATRAGFAAGVAYDNHEGHGGAMTLVRTRKLPTATAFDCGSISFKVHASPHGGACITTTVFTHDDKDAALAGGQRRQHRVTNIYAPSKAKARKKFVHYLAEKLQRATDPPITPETLVCGDFNCVEDRSQDLHFTNVDPKEETRRRKQYCNVGADELNTLFADNALTDAVRRSFGTGGFTHNSTRDDKCTYARLDRWYSPMDDKDDDEETDEHADLHTSSMQYDAQVQAPTERGKCLVWPSDHLPVYLRAVEVGPVPPMQQAAKVMRHRTHAEDHLIAVRSVLDEFFPEREASGDGGDEAADENEDEDKPDYGERFDMANPTDLLNKWHACKIAILTKLDGMRQAHDAKAKEEKKKEKTTNKAAVKTLSSIEDKLFHGVGDQETAKERMQELEKMTEAASTEAFSLGHRLKIARATKEKNSIGSSAFFKPMRETRVSTKMASLAMIDDWNKVVDVPTYKANTGIASTTDDVKEEAAKYYEWLYSPKQNDPQYKDAEVDAALEPLRACQIPEYAANKADAPIAAKEVKKAIKSMALGKACGPDELPPEVYNYSADRFAPVLCAVFRALEKLGHMPDGLNEGIIALLYKKKCRTDIRNYRPLTLLNTDHKILTSVMARRIGDALEHIIPPNQAGFMKGRFICGNSQTAMLLDMLIEGRGEDAQAAVVLLDQEKAFDRVAWPTLSKVVEAVGFGKRMHGLVGTLYNTAHPLRRQLRINGELSRTIELHCGVAQGDACSPVLFLLIMEILAHMLHEEADLQGIQIGDGVQAMRLLVSMFADDTSIYLNNTEGELAAMWRVLRRFEKVTGMRVNDTKTEGFLLGRLRRLRNKIKGEQHASVKWAKDGEHVICLGAPLGHGIDADEFWQGKLLKFQQRAALFARHSYAYATEARIQALSSTALSLFWYNAQTLNMSEQMMGKIEQEFNYAVWKRDPRLEGEARQPGTVSRAFRRWMSQAAAARSKAKGGLNFPEVRRQLSAIRATWVVRYLDPTPAPWKTILDEILLTAADGRGRETLLTRTGAKELASRLRKRYKGDKDGIPNIIGLWLDAILTFNKLPWQEEEAKRDGVAALAIPIFADAVYQPPQLLWPESTQKRIWQGKLNINTIKDMWFHEENRFYTLLELVQFVKGCERATGVNKKIRGKVPAQILVEEWRILKDWVRAHWPEERLHNSQWLPAHGEVVAWVPFVAESDDHPSDDEDGARKGVAPRSAAYPPEEQFLFGRVKRVLDEGEGMQQGFQGDTRWLQVQPLQRTALGKLTTTLQCGGAAETQWQEQEDRDEASGTFMLDVAQARQVTMRNDVLWGVTDAKRAHPVTLKLHTGGERFVPFAKIKTKDIVHALRPSGEPALPPGLHRWTKKLHVDDEPTLAAVTRATKSIIKAWRNPLLTPGDRQDFVKLASRGLYTASHEHRLCPLCKAAQHNALHFLECARLRPLFQLAVDIIGAMEGKFRPLRSYPNREVKMRARAQLIIGFRFTSDCDYPTTKVKALKPLGAGSAAVLALAWTIAYKHATTAMLSRQERIKGALPGTAPSPPIPRRKDTSAEVLKERLVSTMFVRLTGTVEHARHQEMAARARGEKFDPARTLKRLTGRLLHVHDNEVSLDAKVAKAIAAALPNHAKFRAIRLPKRKRAQDGDGAQDDEAEGNSKRQRGERGARASAPSGRAPSAGEQLAQWAQINRMASLSQVSPADRLGDLAAMSGSGDDDDVVGLMTPAHAPARECSEGDDSPVLPTPAYAPRVDDDEENENVEIMTPAAAPRAAEDNAPSSNAARRANFMLCYFGGERTPQREQEVIARPPAPPAAPPDPPSNLQPLHRPRKRGWKSRDKAEGKERPSKRSRGSDAIARVSTSPNGATHKRWY